MGECVLQIPKYSVLGLGHGKVITAIVLCGMQLLIHALTSTTGFRNGSRSWLYSIIYDDVIRYACHNHGTRLINICQLIRPIVTKSVSHILEFCLLISVCVYFRIHKSI